MDTTIAAAVAAQDDFDAVMAGTATDDQCTNVVTVAEQLRAYLQEASLRAAALPDRRNAYFALLPSDTVTAMQTALAMPAQSVQKAQVAQAG